MISDDVRIHTIIISMLLMSKWPCIVTLVHTVYDISMTTLMSFTTASDISVLLYWPATSHVAVEWVLFFVHILLLLLTVLIHLLWRVDVCYACWYIHPPRHDTFVGNSVVVNFLLGLYSRVPEAAFLHIGPPLLVSFFELVFCQLEWRHDLYIYRKGMNHACSIRLVPSVLIFVSLCLWRASLLLHWQPLHRSHHVLPPPCVI